jgi:hypothetical protein
LLIQKERKNQKMLLKKQQDDGIMDMIELLAKLIISNDIITL